MALALCGAGFWAASQWRERLQTLLLLRQMIFHLKGEITHSRTALPEAFFSVGKRFQKCRDDIPGLFIRAADRMSKEGILPFFTIWQAEIEMLPKDFPMAPPDRQALLSMGEQLGYADGAMQERTLLLYLEQLDESISFLRRELAVRTRLYRSLGIAAGLFVLVIMG